MTWLSAPKQPASSLPASPAIMHSLPLNQSKAVTGGNVSLPPNVTDAGSQAQSQSRSLTQKPHKTPSAKATWNSGTASRPWGPAVKTVKRTKPLAWQPIAPQALPPSAKANEVERPTAKRHSANSTAACPKLPRPKPTQPRTLPGPSRSAPANGPTKSAPCNSITAS